MKTFKVVYKQNYPDSENDIRTAYVLAEYFAEAQEKVEKMTDIDEYSHGEVISIEIIQASIITASLIK